MLKRELKVNFKSFILWTMILFSLFLIVYLIYPTIITSENMQSLNEILKVFPPEVLKAFNMDISGIDSAYGWLKTEGFVFILIITGSYSALLGSQIVLKEENDHTIEYLNSLPITRNQIMLNKIICALSYITLMILSLSLFNYIGLSISGDFNHKTYLLLSITPLFSCYTIFSLTLFISTYFNNTKKATSLSLGIVFISYFLQVLSQVSEQTEFLQYFSIFSLANIRHVIANSTINPYMIFISFILSIGLILLAIYHYNKKEFI